MFEDAKHDCCTDVAATTAWVNHLESSDKVWDSRGVPSENAAKRIALDAYTPASRLHDGPVRIEAFLDRPRIWIYGVVLVQIPENGTVHSHSGAFPYLTLRIGLPVRFAHLLNLSS